jgi:hypothetical protein
MIPLKQRTRHTDARRRVQEKRIFKRKRPVEPQVPAVAFREVARAKDGAVVGE